MINLTVLREQNEKTRFERLRRDDSRTAIAPEAARALEADLSRAIKGEVRFDDGSRALYATDGSNYRQAPIGVVVPRDKEDVERTVELVRQYEAPLLGRGCGTSLAGQCCNVAVVMDFSKYMHAVLSIDPDAMLGTVQPGCVLDDLRGAAERYHITFGPDPSTHSHCTLGGMLGNDSCGSHSLLCKNAGRGLRTADNTHELEILTYNGLRLRVGKTTPAEMDGIIRGGGPRGELFGKLRAFIDRYADDIRTGFPKLGRRVSGYNLDALLPENGSNLAQALVGSESTLVTILEATLNLVPSPPVKSMLILGYPDIYTAGDHVLEILPFNPTALEGIDHLLVEFEKEEGGKTAKSLSMLPPGKGFLIVEFRGQTKQEADDSARKCMAALKKQKNPPSMKLMDSPEDEERIWKVREGGLGATAWSPGRPDAWPGWEDSAVPVEKVGPYLRALRDLFSKFDYQPSIYGHLGQGCIHCRVPFDLYTADGIRKFESFMSEAADLVVSYGGSLSGEHGDGQARAQFLPKMFGARLYQAFREFKSLWDPQWKMNPGKVVDPYGIAENLRIGADYNPPQPVTHFQFPDDRHSFARAALRCVGVGNCRQEDNQLMCPSYQVTREEKHCTRGRAHLLFEMMNGEVLTDGWKSEAVKESLDLCLACKGCKSDCPVHVDMATYKAEFLSHYYEGRIRPRYAYSMGLIDVWAWLASFAPKAANFFSQTPVLSAVAKFLGGIAPQRKMPPFATETFKEWFRKRPLHNQDKPPVILWADTFNNYFHPNVGKATVEVLEDAGYQVWVPKAHLCCGRPLYDFGMLDTARKYLRRVLTSLQPQIEADIPIVVMEPSCASVFRDELHEMFPNQKDAQRLKNNTYLFSEFLTKKVDNYRPPRLERKAILHGHCHHKAIFEMHDEYELLQRLGIDYSEPQKTCCGLAGSFGFETGHHDISMQIGEMHLLPAVREANDDTLLITDGFSCHTQIEQGAGRKPLHLAEVIQMALHQGEVWPPQHPAHHHVRDGNGRGRVLRDAAVVGAGALVGGLLLRQLTKARS